MTKLIHFAGLHKFISFKGDECGLTGQRLQSANIFADQKVLLPFASALAYMGWGLRHQRPSVCSVLRPIRETGSTLTKHVLFFSLPHELLYIV
jgi:hypothetical protein